MAHPRVRGCEGTRGVRAQAVQGHKGSDGTKVQRHDVCEGARH